MASIDERILQGRSLRTETPRRSHAHFERDPDLDPVDLVLSQEKGRVENLIPVRRERMAESAFAFYRAGAELMATDLASTPRTGILVQASGDAHISNFGWYGSPERSLVFDANDFDETHRAAWEWDVKRFAASIVIASRGNDLGEKEQRDAARSAVMSYQKAMQDFATKPYLDVWYAHISGDKVLAHLKDKDQNKAARRAAKSFKKASKKNSSHVLGKIGEFVDGQYRIIDDPPFVVPLRSMTSQEDPEKVHRRIREMFERYVDSVDPIVRVLIKKYRIVDVALKVVGVGSVGTRCYIALLEGNGPDDVLFLQMKEAGKSVLEAEFGPSEWEHPGQRVVYGQRLMQASSDILLGWTSTRSGHEYYIRQLKDMKASPDLEDFDARDMTQYASVCGSILARGHARNADPAVISGYIGTNDTFAKAVADFGGAYADQNEQDYRAFTTYLGSGAVS